MEFQCIGSRELKTDDEGNEFSQLRRIENRGTRDGEPIYEVSYSENESARAQGSAVHAASVSEIHELYPEEAEKWESKFRRRWAAVYGATGNPWTPDISDSQVGSSSRIAVVIPSMSRTPGGGSGSSSFNTPQGVGHSGGTSKRVFGMTPPQRAEKKPRSVGPVFDEDDD
jgi:hypothetical protein